MNNRCEELGLIFGVYSHSNTLKESQLFDHCTPLQAGVLSGEVTVGAEITDGGYIHGVHGRASGWTSEQKVDWVP